MSSFIAQYFASRQNLDLTSNYKFDGSEYESKGNIYFYHKFPNDISFTTEPDSTGVRHNLQLQVSNGSRWYSFTMNDCKEAMILGQSNALTVEISEIIDNGKSLSSDWPDIQMYVFFRFVR